MQKDSYSANGDLSVSTLYISQVKRKCGLDVGETYNKPKSKDHAFLNALPTKKKQ